jgi:putative lipoprotein
MATLARRAWTASVLLVPLSWLAGCATQAPLTPEAARAGVVTGKVYYLQRIAVMPDARLDVRLVDATDLDRVKTLASTGGRVQAIPAPFTLKFAPGDVTEGRVYQVRATLTMGGKTWTHTKAYPVLSGGAPAYAEILVSPAH